MRDKIPPIVDADGNDYRVRAREVIGAEHLEAALQWTDRYYEAATREHRSAGWEDGLHHKFYHARAVLRVQPPYWEGLNVTYPGAVLPESVFAVGRLLDPRAREWTAAEWEEEYGNPRFDVQAVSQGRFRVVDNFPLEGGLPFDKSRIIPANMPWVIRDGNRNIQAMVAVIYERHAEYFDVRFTLTGGVNDWWLVRGMGAPITFVVYCQDPDELTG